MADIQRDLTAGMSVDQAKGYLREKGLDVREMENSLSARRDLELSWVSLSEISMIVTVALDENRRVQSVEAHELILTV